MTIKRIRELWSYKNMIDTKEGLELMKGKTFVQVKGAVGDDEMIFVTAEGECFRFAHEQDCCEAVDINDIVGNLEDLVGEPLLVAEEVTNAIEPKEEHYGSCYTYTFYKFATIKGWVDVRWLGESNGYYSESVDFYYQKREVSERDIIRARGGKA